MILRQKKIYLLIMYTFAKGSKVNKLHVSYYGGIVFLNIPSNLSFLSFWSIQEIISSNMIVVNYFFPGPALPMLF